jgi:hypothetical protein
MKRNINDDCDSFEDEDSQIISKKKIIASQTNLLRGKPFGAKQVSFESSDLDGKKWVLNLETRNNREVTQEIVETTPRGTRGKNATPFLLSTPSTQRKKVYNFRTKVIEHLEKLFDDEDEDLVEKFKSQFLNELYREKKKKIIIIIIIIIIIAQSISKLIFC